MKERGIQKPTVLETVKNPDAVRLEEDDLKLFRKEYSKRTLEIVAEIKKNKIIIVTFYWL